MFKKLRICCLLWVATLFLAASATAAQPLRGNTNSKIYHNSSCRYYTCKKCAAVFNSPQEAQNQGYRACKVCGG